MKNNKTHRWIFKIVNSHNKLNIKEGLWDTDFSATQICAYFENLGWEIIFLEQIEDNFIIFYNTAPLGELENEKLL